MMSPVSASQNADTLVCDQDYDLADVTRQISSAPHRRSLYAKIATRRAMIEPIINTFEVRSETCPEDVSGPLNGLPITVKDQIAVSGWPRSFGLERRSTKVEKKSAQLVANLQAIGAVVTGKTALPPNALDFQTGNARRGPTNNPYNPAFTTGGSTGGGAAAVASGMSLLDVGSDLGGSLRIPAGWCGVTSYTPTEGLWPNDGMLRGSHTLAHFARIGLTARTASDIGHVWHLLRTDKHETFEDWKAQRIALWKPDAQAMCDEDTLTAWERFGKSIALQHAATTSDQMQALFDPDIYRLAGEIIGYETGALVPWPIRWLMRHDRRAADTSPGFVAHVHAGYKRDDKRHRDNLKKLTDLRATALKTWEGVDALLLPTSGVCAFEHTMPVRDQNGVRTYDKEFATGAGNLGYFDALTRFTLPLTVLGWPVVNLPIGHDSNGIPVGAQLAGKPGDDGNILALARELQHLLARSRT